MTPESKDKKERKKMKKKMISVLLTVVMTASMLAGCGSTAETGETAAEDKRQEEASAAEVEGTPATEAEETTATEDKVSATESEETAGSAAEEQETTVTIFAAKSLNTVLEELIGMYEEEHPKVEIVGSYDSSGTLMTQIEEGAACDIFFSAAQKQMNELEEKGYLTEGTRHNVVNNQVCVVTYEGSNTAVTGLADLAKAENMALADGSVPVGKYTRQALVNAGMLPEAEDVSAITTEEVSEALGGIEINECANVGAVTAAVAEGSNEVGTIYYSDSYGFEDKIKILEVVPYDLTGDVIYPIAGTVNEEADEIETAAAEDFIRFLISEEAKAVYEKYYFDTDVED